MQFLVFASVFLLVMVLLNVYIWRRFLRLLDFDKANYFLLLILLLT